MRLENIVWDARDPHRLGAFWSAALDAVPITDEPAGYEARMNLSDDVFLDLSFQRVGDMSTSPARMHLDLADGDEQAKRVERLLDIVILVRSGHGAAARPLSSARHAFRYHP